MFYGVSGLICLNVLSRHDKILPWAVPVIWTRRQLDSANYLRQVLGLSLVQTIVQTNKQPVWPQRQTIDKTATSCDYDVRVPRLDPEVIKISCSIQLSMKTFLLINIKNTNNCWHFNIYEQEK